MTVKELKDILDGCNDDAVVIVLGWDTGTNYIQDKQVYADPDGTRVVIDVDGYYEHQLSELKMLDSATPSRADFITKWADIRKDGK